MQLPCRAAQQREGGVSDVVPLSFEGSAVRVVERGEETWWVLADVCRALDLTNPSMVAARLDEDEKDALSITDPIGRHQQTTIISEPGLYAIIQQSRKPIARRFDRWVRHEVLPSIRKTGRYVTQYDGAVVLQQIGELAARFDRRLDVLEQLARSKRRRPSDPDRRTTERFARCHGGNCPCCRRADVVDAQGNRINDAEIDHFYSVDRATLDAVWLICGECHQKLTTGLMPRKMAAGRFAAYQELLNEWLKENAGPLFALTPQPEVQPPPSPPAAESEPSAPQKDPKPAIQKDVRQESLDLPPHGVSRAERICSAIYFACGNSASIAEIGACGIATEGNDALASVRNGILRQLEGSTEHTKPPWNAKPTLFRLADPDMKGRSGVRYSCTEIGIEIAKRVGPLPSRPA